MSACSTTACACGSCPPPKDPFFTIMPAVQQFLLISSAPIFPPAPTLTAKPVTVISEGGTAGTEIGPLNAIGTPEAPLRIRLERVFAEKGDLVIAKAPAAR